MANTKSAKKRAQQNLKRRAINLERKTALKTAIKKILVALEQKDANIKELLVQAESKLARAKNKGTLHPRTARRTISRLAHKVAQTKQATPKT